MASRYLTQTPNLTPNRVPNRNDVIVYLTLYILIYKAPPLTSGKYGSPQVDPDAKME